MSKYQHKTLIKCIVDSASVIFQNICLYLTMKEIKEYISKQKKQNQQQLKRFINCNTVFKHIFKQIYQNKNVIQLHCVHQTLQDHLNEWQFNLEYVTWFKDDEKPIICLDLASKSLQNYTLYDPSWHDYFNESDLFNFLCRILPFKYPFKINFEDVYNIKYKFRDLTSMEKSVFRCVYIKKHNFEIVVEDVTSLINHGNTLNIVNYQNFKNNLNGMFYFSYWECMIDWRFFILIGRCVSSALFKVNISDQRSNTFKVNICSYKINFKKFKSEILKIHKKLMDASSAGRINYNFENGCDNQKLFILNIIEQNGKNVTLIISHCCDFRDLSHFLNVSIDLFQVLYFPNKNKILATPMFIQCVESGFVIPYNIMLNEKYIYFEAITIIQDLVKNNISYFLVPKQVSMDNLQQIFQNEFKFHHLYFYNQVDFYDIQNEFLRKYIK